MEIARKNTETLLLPIFFAQFKTFRAPEGFLDDTWESVQPLYFKRFVDVLLPYLAENLGARLIPYQKRDPSFDSLGSKLKGSALSLDWMQVQQNDAEEKGELVVKITRPGAAVSWLYLLNLPDGKKIHSFEDIPANLPEVVRSAELK